MELTAFLEKCFDKRVKLSRKAPGNIPWAVHFKLAELTKNIQFGCTFNDKGKCKQGGRYSTCCCSSCHYSIGHFSVLPEDLSIVKEIANLFDAKDKKGFRSDKGCVLPRQYRSSTCLGHACHDAMKPIQPVWKILLYWFANNRYAEESRYVNHMVFATHRWGYRTPGLAIEIEDLRKILGPRKWPAYWNKYLKMEAFEQ